MVRSAQGGEGVKRIGFLDVCRLFSPGAFKQLSKGVWARGDLCETLNNVFLKLIGILQLLPVWVSHGYLKGFPLVSQEGSFSGPKTVGPAGELRP